MNARRLLALHARSEPAFEALYLELARRDPAAFACLAEAGRMLIAGKVSAKDVSALTPLANSLFAQFDREGALERRPSPTSAAGRSGSATSALRGSQSTSSRAPPRRSR